MRRIKSGRLMAGSALAGMVLAGMLSNGRAQTPGPAGAAQARVRIANVRQIDNERVTVSRLTFPPGAREEMHLKLQALVVIQGTAGDVEVSLGSETTTGRVEPGKTWYVSKTTEHAYSNVGREPFDLLVVFLK